MREFSLILPARTSWRSFDRGDGMWHLGWLCRRPRCRPPPWSCSRHPQTSPSQFSGLEPRDKQATTLGLSQPKNRGHGSQFLHVRINYDNADQPILKKLQRRI